MKYLSLFMIILVSFTSCDWAKQKTKQTVNKAGEVAAKTGSEFADGVAKGVEKTFQNEVSLSESLKKEGVSSGKIIINSTDSTSDNIITAYLIFNNDFNRNITIKVFDINGNEYGRVMQKLDAKRGEAKYIDFAFDKRTNIDGRGKITFE